MGRDPQRDVAALDEGSVVLGPVGDSRLRLALGLHAGVHAEVFGSLILKALETDSRGLPGR